MKTLDISEKWSIEYDDEHNDRPVRWLRHDEEHHPFDEGNSVTALFYALLSYKETS